MTETGAGLIHEASAPIAFHLQNKLDTSLVRRAAMIERKPKGPLIRPSATFSPKGEGDNRRAQTCGPLP